MSLNPKTAGAGSELDAKAPKLSSRTSLYWKLAKVFLIMNAIGGVLHFLVFFWLHHLFFDQVEQRINWELAQEYERVLRPFLVPVFKKAELEEKLFDLQRRNPRIDIHLLNAEGTVIVTGSFNNTGFGVRVPLEPIHEFLSHEGYGLMPFYGRDPGNSGVLEKVPFSAAQTLIGEEEGYLYVNLRGLYYRAAFQELGDFTISVVSGVFLLLLALFTTILGMFLARLLTRRFHGLTQAIRHFAAGNYTVRVSEIANDELGLHAYAFNEMAETIQQNVKALKEQDNLRRQLVANVSHDLRTPLGAMQSLLETLRSDFMEMPGDEKDLYLERALINCQDLNSLVSDLFELSSLNARSSVPDLEVIELIGLLRTVLKKFVLKAEEKDLAISLDVLENSIPVFADEKMINRVLSNLVENAIRYSEQGGAISIGARSVDTQRAEVFVSDTGPGIAQDEVEHIFERFYRGKRAKVTEKSGTGLGLAISKRIIELHGEDISAESEVGKGSTFRFSLKKSSKSEN